MGIQSLDELKKLREQHQSTTKLRSGDGDTADQIEILIGMATCGIAAGARETLGEFTKQFAEKNITGVKIVPVGCLGLCKAEPMIQVNVPGEQPVVYGNITKDNVEKVVTQHIIGKTPVAPLVLDAKFGHA